MSDGEDIEGAADGPAAENGPQGGERLAAARREQQITVVEVAKELHLDERKVRALEQNEFDVLGAPVFAKGHLRKYAQLVGVPIDDVLADYYALNRTSGMPPVVGAVRKPARELTPGPWLAVIVVVIVVVTAYWYYVVRDIDTTAADSNAPIAESVDTDTGGESSAGEPFVIDAAAVPGEDAAAAGQAIDLADEIAADAQAVQPSTEVADSAPPVGEQVRLTLSFSGDCWTEISDAGGRQLFFDLGRDGRVANVTGQAPLAVLFGNADNVSLRVNGEPYDIGADVRRGQTARLTIRSPE